MDLLCPTVERVKKDDDEGKKKRASVSPLVLVVAALVFAGVACAMLAKGKHVGPFFGQRSRKASAASPAVESSTDGSLVIPAWRAAAQLNYTRWQYGNVSQGRYPDGHPVHFFTSPNSVVWSLAEQQRWESETFRVFRTVLTDPAARRPGAWMLDIGGWIGITGLYAAQFVPNVMAFEPDIAARSELVANVWLNPLYERKIRITDKCVNHERATITMKGDPGASWSSILFGDNDKGTLVAWQVQCLPFEEHLQTAGIDGADVVFIKIDIEGAEHTVLPAMRGWLKAHGNPPVYLSMHRWLWGDKDTANKRLLEVFRDYAHVYNAALAEVPRDTLDLAWMEQAGDPAYLLSMKRYDFVELSIGTFAAQGGALPDPVGVPAKKGASGTRHGVRGRAADAEEAAEDADAVAAEGQEEEEDGNDDGAEADDASAPEVAGEMAESEEEEEEAEADSSASGADAGDAEESAPEELDSSDAEGQGPDGDASSGAEVEDGETGDAGDEVDEADAAPAVESGAGDEDAADDDGSAPEGEEEGEDSTGQR